MSEMKKMNKKQELEELKQLLKKKGHQKERLRKLTRSKTNKTKMLEQMTRATEEKSNRDEKIVGQMINMLKFLKGNEKLPAIVFIFSKKALVSMAEGVSNHLDLVNAGERRAIEMFFYKAISQLKSYDKEIQQIVSLRQILIRGIGIHHGDLLPICKEIVEILMQRGLVKLLFATESFAMGLNMPTRSVIFATLFKFETGGQFRQLNSGEYLQMAGRAGRRGKDTAGFVYIFVPDASKMVQSHFLKVMMDSKGEVLRSKFKLSYSVIINSYRSDDLLIDDLMKKSFTENKNYVKIKALKNRNSDLRSLKRKFTCIKENNTVYDIEDASPIVEFAQKLNALKDLEEQFRSIVDGESKKLIRSYVPAFARVIDLRGNSHVLLLEYMVDEKRMVFEGVIAKLSHEVAEVNLRKIENKTKNIMCDEKFYNLSYFEVPVERILEYYDITIDSHSEQRAQFLNEYGECIEQIESGEIGVIEFDQNYESYLKILKEYVDTLEKSKCFGCSLLDNHYSLLVKKTDQQKELAKNMDEIVKLEKAFDLETYKKILEVLKKMNFVDKELIPTKLMEIAKICGSGPDIILFTLLSTNNVLEQLEPNEIPALLSVSSMNGKSSDYNDLFMQKLNMLPLTDTLKHSIYWINEKFCELKLVESEMKISFDEFISFDMIEPIYEWTNGTDFATISLMTEKLEGQIIRAIYKIDKCLENLKRVYASIKNEAMVLKMEACLTLIRRDILVTRSLYLQS